MVFSTKSRRAARLSLLPGETISITATIRPRWCLTTTRLPFRPHGRVRSVFRRQRFRLPARRAQGGQPIVPRAPRGREEDGRGSTPARSRSTNPGGNGETAQPARGSSHGSAWFCSCLRYFFAPAYVASSCPFYAAGTTASISSVGTHRRRALYRERFTTDGRRGRMILLDGSAYLSMNKSVI